MDRIRPQTAVRFWVSLLILVLLQTSAEAQICSGPLSVEVEENNFVGQVIVNFTTDSGVTLRFTQETPNNPFEIRGDQLIAKVVLDHEDSPSHEVHITCTQTPSGAEFSIIVVVFVDNVNDNPPKFDKTQYSLSIDELLPVGTSVGSFPATDLDRHPQLYYSVTSDPEFFTMQTPTSPNIVVAKLLDYDKVKKLTLTLFAQDTPTPPPEGQPSFTATTTILVTIKDFDNRPPWFLPCTEYNIGDALICQGSGYTGSVVLTEKEEGALPLTPGPLHAIDGDFGIDDEITYTFLRGNEAGLFEINDKTGNITMLRPADIPGPINLTVMATQKNNSFQYATTKVTVKVLLASMNPPQFQKAQYDGVVTGIGTMAVDSNNTSEPLRIQATDADFASGVNPDITYKIHGSSDFSLIGGYLFMTRDRPLGTVSLQVEAVDTSSGESDKAELTVEVTSGLATTSVAPNTTHITPTTPTEETTGFPTSNSSMTTEDSESTASTAQPQTEGTVGPEGGYSPEDMAALGASLAVLLFICLVVIGFLACRIKKSEADWGKMSEANTFGSSLSQGPGGRKEGVQFTNEAFHHDEDAGSSGSAGPKEEDVKPGGGWGSKAPDVPDKQSVLQSAAALHALLPDNTSLQGSDKADSEVEVRPILTKERRTEDGYKAVWFKEDIDPSAKEEVVIIPDNREREGEEEEEEEEEEGSSSEEDSLAVPASRVVFADADKDSGLGDKMEDPAENSDHGEMSTTDL